MSTSKENSDIWEAAFHLIRTRSHVRRSERFRLVSGQMSHDYIDGKRAIDTGSRLATVSRAVIELADSNGLEFNAVGGMTMGADPLAHGIALLADTAWFSVRTERKSRGLNQWIEGSAIGSDTRVLLVDDVVSTGGSTLKALERVKATGATIAGVIPMVDRGELAAAVFAELDVRNSDEILEF